MIKVKVTGAVLPAGAAVTASLPPGKTVLKVISWKGENYGVEGARSEHDEVECEYPDGFLKSHQIKNIEDLVPKVVNTLRGRYGVTGSIEVIKLPVKTGDVLELEISDGK